MLHTFPHRPDDGTDGTARPHSRVSDHHPTVNDMRVTTGNLRESSVNLRSYPYNREQNKNGHPSSRPGVSAPFALSPRDSLGYAGNLIDTRDYRSPFTRSDGGSRDYIGYSQPAPTEAPWLFCCPAGQERVIRRRERQLVRRLRWNFWSEDETMRAVMREARRRHSLSVRRSVRDGVL